MSGDTELRILLDPPGMDADIGARFLTRCFGTRWTAAMYRWYLQRSFGGEAPERLIMVDGGRVVAVIALVFRLLRTPDDTVHRVSVLVAGATLPGERGRGCYARILQAALARSALRGCTAALGFVTADNATGRGLLRLGAVGVASAYIASPGVARTHAGATLRLWGAMTTDRWPARASARLASPPLQAGFHYPDFSAWASQMLDRPHHVQPLRVGTTCRALVESVEETDRLQWLDGDPRERAAAIRALAAHAHHRRRQFFMYSTRCEDLATAHRLGLLARPGCMMMVAPEARHEATVRNWAALSWDVQSGDRM
ncbi:MAG: GNAT family N-acetyltransferase [Gammaproteobacteria bacterium]|jgi:Acetyltransferase (GNAT) domain|nr:MAG: GNAT family N-acetyltransferase [Gammaproteobacteria bacterium]